MQFLAHALVQMGMVGHCHVIGKLLSVKHAREPPAFRATLVAAGLDHAVPRRHSVILLSHFQEVIQKMVKRIPPTVALHVSLVAIPHLHQHVPKQAQGQTGHNVLPVAELVFGKGMPERQSHGKDAMTDVSHGSEPMHVQSNA